MKFNRIDMAENNNKAFDDVFEKCAYITPVPKGVGPMTIVSLMKNTLLAAKGVIYS